MPVAITGWFPWLFPKDLGKLSPQSQTLLLTQPYSDPRNIILIFYMRELRPRLPSVTQLVNVEHKDLLLNVFYSKPKCKPP